jgi:hypothetical protein
VIATTARPFALGVDTVVPLTPYAPALKSAGMSFAIRYLGSVSGEEVHAILAAGLAFMPVTYAKAYSGMGAINQLRMLSLPEGCTVWLDLEGETDAAPDIIAKINAWAGQIQAGGYEAGLYVGAGCVLTSEELYGLKVTRYWDSCSREIDRNGRSAAPKCDYCMVQLRPFNTNIGGVVVDVDVVQRDVLGRLPTWVTA